MILSITGRRVLRTLLFLCVVLLLLLLFTSLSGFRIQHSTLVVSNIYSWLAGKTAGKVTGHMTVQPGNEIQLQRDSLPSTASFGGLRKVYKSASSTRKSLASLNKSSLGVKGKIHASEMSLSNKNRIAGATKGLSNMNKSKSLMSNKEKINVKNRSSYAAKTDKRTLKPIFQNTTHVVTQTTRTTLRYVDRPTSAKPTKPPRHYIAMRYEGRLGNHIFEYASLLGIARKNNLIPLLDRSSPLRSIFKVSADEAENHSREVFSFEYREKKGCTYEPEVMELGGGRNVMLIGFFQSWKYIKDIESDIMRQFRFQDHIVNEAKIQFLRAISPKLKTRRYKGNATYVAVHVRRGDMVNRPDYVKYGYTSPGADYYKRAMEIFKKKFRNCLFVVSSDDVNWCKNNINGSDVVFLNSGNKAEVDMAALTMCNHTLMSGGSYGWWISWWNNGTTVYYKGYPTPGSSLYKLFNAEDYRPPSWIGLDWIHVHMRP